MSNDGQKYTTNCNGILRGVQFGWNEYEGVRQPQLVGRFELIDGDDAGKFETWFASLSEDENSKGVQFCEFTFRALRACGWTGADLAELPELVEAGKLANEVGLVREHKLKQDKETGKDVWRSSVKYVNTGGGAKVDLKENAMSASDVADFARRMKARLGGTGASKSTGSTGNGERRTVQPPPSNRRSGRDDVPPPDDDDRIPF